MEVEEEERGAWRGKRTSDAESVLAEKDVSLVKSLKRGKIVYVLGGRCVCVLYTSSLGVCVIRTALFFL